MDVDAQEAENQLEFLKNESADDYCKRVMGVIRCCQRLSNDLQGWQHYADYSGVQFTMTRINKLLHTLISHVFKHQDIKLDMNGFKLSSQFDILREGNDALFERINSDIDEASGIRRNIDIEIVDSTVRTIHGPAATVGPSMTLHAPRNVQKPQLFFSPKINNSKEPFIPLIKEKPNSMKPLSVMICLMDEGTEFYSHPYEYELHHFTIPSSSLAKRDPICPLGMDETPFEMVVDEQSLGRMMEELGSADELAVDLEHHSFRSYQGLTSLIQISTRSKDYVVDPFPLRNQLAVLNDVFTNPKVTKVLHGSDRDVEWLQRDFGVYLVNMFDTHQAAIVLQYPHRSLGNLLYSFCGVVANKNYQRADWRIRPLPLDFLKYARSDTHYLLFIHDLMRNELVDKGNDANNLLVATYDRSTELCLKRYEKPVMSVESHMEMYRRSKKFFNTRQMFALQRIYAWRDTVARQHDESVDYVLPKHMMLEMCLVMPKEMQGILACCNPIPIMVKTEQLTLHQIIREAKERPIEEITVETTPHQNEPDVGFDCDPISTLIRKHDLTLIEDDPRGLSTLLAPHETLLGDLFEESAVSVQLKGRSDMFGFQESLRCIKANLNQLTKEYMSPYERYQIYLTHETDQKEDETQTDTPPPTKDLERINKIKLHFLSLTQTSTDDVGSKSDSSSDSDSNTDLQRLERLQNHIASLANIPSNTTNKKKKKNKKLSINEKHKKERENKLKRKSGEMEDSPSSPLPADDVINKKLKSDDVTGNKMAAVDDVTPFDYEAQDLKIFEAKKSFKKKKLGVKERFKGKGSNKATGLKKSGIKSLAWGDQNKKR